ncbi:hypothetical protein EGM51_09035 [Verrucomicrobia bacterium S94]|nr:hypothetical protein EGM51_09035 [Verrucomicrobia bacterium S94]
MTRSDAWLLHSSNGLVIVTGLVYAWMAYGCESDDPYAIVGHPWQPHIQHAHIWVTPLLVLMLGHLWARHAEPHLKRKTGKRKNSGLSMLYSALPMIFSGYAIMTAIEPVWRKTWIIVHLMASLIWILGYLVHLLQKVRPVSPLSRN